MDTELPTDTKLLVRQLMALSLLLCALIILVTMLQYPTFPLPYFLADSSLEYALAEQYSDLVNINSANLEELQTLPGIGPKLGEKIIAYREEHGVFTDVRELKNIQGIGEKTLEKLLPYIFVA